MAKITEEVHEGEWEEFSCVCEREKKTQRMCDIVMREREVASPRASPMTELFSIARERGRRSPHPPLTCTDVHAKEK